MTEKILEGLQCGKSGCECHRSSNKGWGLTHCPAHVDDDPSLSIGDKDGKVVWKCHSGCTQNAVLDALKGRGLYGSSEDAPTAKMNVAATYDYTDRDGNLSFQVVRLLPKDFRQRRLVNDAWVWNVPDEVRTVVYRLPEVLAAIERGETVYIVEGEKDADSLAFKFGVAVTTSPGGAGKWKDIYAQYFVNADVVVIADNDDPGKKHAREVAVSVEMTAKSVKVIELPQKDASDWLDAGGTKDQLEKIVAGTTVWNSEGRRILSGPDLASMYTDVMAKRMTGDPDYIGIPTGLGALDKYIAYRMGELMIVMASTGVGKSALLTTMQLDLDARGIPSMFISLEMSWVVIVDRMIAGGMSLEQLSNRAGLLVDEPSLTTDRLEVLVKIAKMRGARVIFVDYAQRMVAKGDSEYERVSLISNELARIAREARVQIVAAAQVSRQGSRRDGNAPGMEKIRASGHLEQDASVILSIGRKVGESATKVVIEKNRHGGTGHVMLDFKASQAKFVSPTAMEPKGAPKRYEAKD